MQNAIPAPERASAGRLAFIDALRGYAIAGVILYHCWGVCDGALAGLDSRIVRIAGEGLRGVQLFFLVSAFTLSLSMATARERGRFSLRGFFANRVLRILPLYWLALIVYPSLRAWDGSGGLSWTQALACASFLNWLTPATIHLGVPGGWSVVCEVWFYALLPFLSARLKDGASALKALLAALAARAMAYAWLEGHPLPLAGDYRGWLYHVLPNQLPVFLAGIVLYHAYAGGGKAFPRSAAAPAWLGLGAYALAACLWNFDFLLPGEYRFTIAFFAIAWAISDGRHAWVVNRPIAFVGRISYSAYICHFLALHYAARALLPRLAAWGRPNAAFAAFCAIVFPIVILVSFLLYKGIEGPAQRAGKRWLSAVTKRP